MKDDADTNLLASFAYDALGRRIEYHDETNETVTKYYYDGANEILEADGEGIVRKWYVHGVSYVDGRLMMWHRDSERPYYYAIDRMYDVRAVVDRAGAMVERYSYDPYGRPYIRESMGRGDMNNSGDATTADGDLFDDAFNKQIWDPRADLDDDGDIDEDDETLFASKAADWESKDGPTVAQALSDMGNPFMFQGRPHFAIATESDDEVATFMLNDHRNRFEEPVIGRWLTRDPVGYWAGTANLYEAVASGPTYWLDPLGLDVWVDGQPDDAPPDEDGIPGDADDLRADCEARLERAKKAINKGAQIAEEAAELIGETIILVGGMITPVPGDEVAAATMLASKLRRLVEALEKVASRSKYARKLLARARELLRKANRIVDDAKDARRCKGKPDAPDVPPPDCPAPPPKCFVAGTRVAMADGTLRPIEELCPGDHVLCDYDPELHNGPEIGEVVDVYQDKVCEVLDLTLISETGNWFKLSTTSEHPFYDANIQRYVRACELNENSCTHGQSGVAASVVCKEMRPATLSVFNLKVKGGSNYFVGDSNGDISILVHNKPGDIEKPSGSGSSGGKPHTKGKRKSTTGEHQAGEARKQQDRGGEKGDERRDAPRRRPKNWRGPWPPKK